MMLLQDAVVEQMEINIIDRFLQIGEFDINTKLITERFR